MSIEAHLDDFDALVTRGKRSAETARMMITHAKNLLRLIGDHAPMSDLTLVRLNEYVEEREAEGATPSTIAKELSTVRGMLRVARKKGYFSASVDAVVPDLSTEYVPRKRWFTRDEAWRLIEHFADRDRVEKTGEDRGRAAVVAFIFGSGARWSEAMAARDGDYDARTKRLKIRGTKTEGAARVIPVLPHMAAFLDWSMTRATGKDSTFRRWDSVRRDVAIAAASIGLHLNEGDDGKVVTSRVVDAKGKTLAGKPVNVLLKQDGARLVDCPSPNDMRRSFCSWLVEDGVPHELCARLMGHSSPAMVGRVYGRSRPQTLEDLLSIHYGRRASALAAE